MWEITQENNLPRKHKYEAHQMSTQKPNSKLSQKIITLLLIVKLMLIGAQADKRIQQGDAPIEVLIWMINQCIPVLQQAGKLGDQQKQDNQKNLKAKK